MEKNGSYFFVRDHDVNFWKQMYVVNLSNFLTVETQDFNKESYKGLLVEALISSQISF